MGSPGGRDTDKMKKVSRRSAFEECERLTNMASAIGAGMSVIPIPGTSVAMRGIELLLMGAIAKIWNHRLTPTFMNAMWAALGARLGIVVAASLVGDVVGMIPGFGLVAKPAIAGGLLKLVGSMMNEWMRKSADDPDTPAHVTAEEARDILKDAAERIAIHAPDLKDGAQELFKGDGTKLSRTLNKIFDLGGGDEA